MRGVWTELESCGLKVAQSPFSILLPPGKAQAQPAHPHGQGLFLPRDRTNLSVD